MEIEAQCPPGKQLVSTSQGNTFDIPPVQWLPDELRKFGVIGKPIVPFIALGTANYLYEVRGSLSESKEKGLLICGFNLNYRKFSKLLLRLGTPNTGAPDIEGPIHTFFSSKCWPQLHHNSRRFKAMRPSLILATKLLEVSGPFIASFLPERKYDEDDGRVEVCPAVSLESVTLAFQELEDIACQTKVREDESMWPNMGRHGIILPTGSGIKPDEPVRDGVDAECWEKTTERDRDAGLRFRRLTIHLASQFGNTLESLVDENPGGEQYIQASFMCAVTLVHEIAHLINAANFESYTWLGEPRVNRESLMELGTSLIGWLFDGWFPENISLTSETHDGYSFENGCCWHKQRREPRGYPQYHTLHSIPMAHIKRILSEVEWGKFDENDTQFSIQVREELLRPQLPFRAGETARIAWKRQDHCFDMSPALVPYYDVWDYHDPDWQGPEVGQDSRLTDASSPRPSPTRSVSTSPAKVITGKGMANLSLESSRSPKPGKALTIAKANSPMVRADGIDHGERGIIPSNKQQSRDPSPSSSQKPNRSVKKSSRSRPVSKQRVRKISAGNDVTRRSRRLLGRPAEHAGGLPHSSRKKARTEEAK